MVEIFEFIASLWVLFMVLGVMAMLTKMMLDGLMDIWR